MCFDQRLDLIAPASGGGLSVVSYILTTAMFVYQITVESWNQYTVTHTIDRAKALDHKAAGDRVYPMIAKVYLPS